MSQSPEQQDLFAHLNSPAGFGVFLFPPLFSKRQDSIDALNATRNALAYLEGHLGDSKIKARNSKGVSRILDWLVDFKFKVGRGADRFTILTDDQYERVSKSGSLMSVVTMPDEKFNSEYDYVPPEINGGINGRSSGATSPAKAGRAS